MKKTAILMLSALLTQLPATHAEVTRNALGPWYEPPTDRFWNIELLLGWEYEPDYPGADSYESELGGLVRLNFMDNGNRLYQLGLESAAVTFRNPAWAFQAGLEYEEGDEGESADLDGLDEIDDTVEGEFTLTRKITDHSYVYAKFQPDLLDKGKGLVYFLGIGQDRVFLDEKLRLSPAFDVSWGNNTHMNTEFDITAAEAPRIGLDEYNPDGGLKSSTLGLQVEYTINKNWALLSLVEWEHYYGDAADSPLIADIGSEDTVEALGGIFFRW